MVTKEELRKIILDNLKIGSLPLDAQDKILEKLGGNIIKRITLATLENLPEKARDEFDAISESGDQIKMQEFLKSQIPNFEKLIRETIKFTIDEFKELSGIK